MEKKRKLILNKDRLCRHYRAIGLKSKEASRFANLIDKWVKSNGAEWTVSRLKELSQALKQNLSTGEYHVPEGWATKVNRKGNKILKDDLVHRMLCSKTDNEIFLANTFFKSYTLIMFNADERPTRKQIGKFNQAVFGDKSESYEQSKVDEICRWISTNFPKLLTKTGLKAPLKVSFTPLAFQSPVREKFSPVFDEDSNIPVSVRRTDIRTKSLDVLEKHQGLYNLWKRFPHEVSDCLVGNGATFVVPRHQDFVEDMPVGKMGYIQEPGCKLRAVANPALAVQALGEPLKVKLAKISTKIFGIYTFNQEEGREKTRTWLSEGKTCYAFDASSFTDRFPLQLQLAMVESLVEEGYVSKFDYESCLTCSDVSYYSEIHSHLIRYTAGGQPQGWGPSFHMAAITHTLICYYCCAMLNIKPNCFCVIGDDIVISNQGVADMYSSVMTSCGVDVNMEKSITSNTLSEFAGKLITKDSIIPSIKLKPGNRSEDQYVKLLDFYPPQFWLTLSKSEREKAIKAILPEYLGGIRFIIPGLTFKQMFDMVDWDEVQRREILKDFKQSLGNYSHASLASFRSFVNQFYDEIDMNLTEVELNQHARLHGFEGQVRLSNLSGLIYRQLDLSEEKLQGESTKITPFERMIVSSIINDFNYEKESLVGRPKHDFRNIAFNTMYRSGIPREYIQRYVHSQGYELERFQVLVKTELDKVIYQQVDNPMSSDNTKQRSNHGKKSIIKPDIRNFI